MRLVALLAGALLALAGCSAVPSEGDILDQFEAATAESLGADVDNPHVKEIAEILSRGAAKGCNDATTWRIMSTPGSDGEWQPSFQRIWAVSCMALYADRLDPALHERYRAVAATEVG